MKNQINNHTEKQPNESPDIGNFINWHLKVTKTKKKNVSDYLGILPTTLNQYFKQKTINFIILWRISQAVNHNFLMELGEKWLKIDYQTEKEKQLLQELAEKEAEIATLKTKIEVYKEICGVGN